MRPVQQNKFDVGKVQAHEATVKITEHEYIYGKPYKCNTIDQKKLRVKVINC